MALLEPPDTIERYNQHHDITTIFGNPSFNTCFGLNISMYIITLHLYTHNKYCMLLLGPKANLFCVVGLYNEEYLL